MTPVAAKHKRSLEILHGVDIGDAPQKGVAVIYGPRTYVDSVYRARNGGRQHPSPTNTIRAADVIKQHLGIGPAPTFRSSEQQDHRPDRDRIELKIPKQRKRARADAASGQTESEAWETARKKATQKLTGPVLGRAGQTPRRSSACFAGAEGCVQPAGQNETAQTDREKRGVGIEAQRSDGSRITSMEQHELPQSIPEELYEAFTPPTSRSTEDHSLAIATDPESSPSDTDDGLSTGKPTMPANSTLDGSTAFSAHHTSDPTVLPLGNPFDGDAPVSMRKRRRRFCSTAITATFHMD